MSFDSLLEDMDLLRVGRFVETLPSAEHVSIGTTGYHLSSTGNRISLYSLRSRFYASAACMIPIVLRFMEGGYR